MIPGPGTRLLDSSCHELFAATAAGTSFVRRMPPGRRTLDAARRRGSLERAGNWPLDGCGRFHMRHAELHLSFQIAEPTR